MLKLAILYKDEITKNFMERVYDDEFFYYSGYAYSNCAIPEIKLTDNVFQYAIVSNDKLIGYFSYRVQPESNSVCNFGFYSFDKGNPTVAKDVFLKMEELTKRMRRIEWKMVGGNKVEKHYDQFCFSHGGNKVVLHDVCKDSYGKYHDECIYEILNKEAHYD